MSCDAIPGKFWPNQLVAHKVPHRSRFAWHATDGITEGAAIVYASTAACASITCFAQCPASGSSPPMLSAVPLVTLAVPARPVHDALVVAMLAADTAIPIWWLAASVAIT